nr:alpha/beta hydrolase-fold protein [Microbacterium sp. BK668]
MKGHEWADRWALDVLEIATSRGKRTVRVFHPSPLDASVTLPLVVFQDGQRVFATEGASWRAAETIASLVEARLIPPVVAVGIDNAGPERAVEYSHVVPFPRQPGAPAEGERYEELVIDEIIPELRERYPLTRDAAHTAVIGSSLGGLVSYHLSFRHPEVFGLAGILSPYLAHIDPHRGSEHRVWASFPQAGPRRIWLDVGDTEATLTVAQITDLRDHLLDLGYRDGENLAWRLHRGGTHNEECWAERLPSVLLHLFAPPAPIVEAGLDLPHEIPVGQRRMPVAPLVTHENGMQRNTLLPVQVFDDHTATAGRLGDVLVREPGQFAAAISTSIGDLRGAVEVTPSPHVARLQVTVHGEGLDGEDALTYSWLPLERLSQNTFGGVFHLPVGLAFDGSLTRHSDSFTPADSNGNPERWPLRLLADDTVDITVHRWMPSPDPL